MHANLSRTVGALASSLSVGLVVPLPLDSQAQGETASLVFGVEHLRGTSRFQSCPISSVYPVRETRPGGPERPLIGRAPAAQGHGFT